MLEILTLFIAGVIQYASSKTMRYFVNENGFVQNTVNVIYTLLSIRSLGKKVSIKVGDEVYLTTDYRATRALVELIECGRVWINGDSMLSHEPAFVCEKPECEVTYEGKNYTARIIDPSTVEQYFKKLNDSQPEDRKYQIDEVSFGECVSLFDFKGLVTPDDIQRVMVFNAGGTRDEKVSYFNHVMAPYDSDFVRTHPIESKEVLERWLASVEEKG